MIKKIYSLIHLKIYSLNDYKKIYSLNDNKKYVLWMIIKNIKYIPWMI